MEQVIHFKGLTLAGSELSASVGELAVCANLESHEGELRVASMEGTEAATEVSGTLVYVHTVDKLPHYLYMKYNASDKCSYIYCGSEKVFSNMLGDGRDGFISLSSVDNTLILLTDSGKYFSLWKNGSYHDLGAKPGMLEIQFRIGSVGQQSYYSMDGITEPPLIFHSAFGKVEGEVESIFAVSGRNATIKEEAQVRLTEATWALINRTNSDIADHNRFYAPFFVRYCYTLYDGSQLWHSSPVLMNPLTRNKTAVQVMNIISGQTGDAELVGEGKANCDFKFMNNPKLIKFEGVVLRYTPANNTLQYRIANSSVLQGWEDVVKSVDIYMSQQMPGYDTAAKISDVEILGEVYDGSHMSNGSGFVNNGTEIGLTDLLDCKFDATGKYCAHTLKIPQISARERYQPAAFYHIYSINSEVLGSYGPAFTDIPFASGVVKNITAQPQMRDEYKSHHTLLADGQYVYNRRLHLYGVKEKLFNGFSSEVMLPYLTTRGNDHSLTIRSIKVRISTPTGSVVVQKSVSDSTKYSYSALATLYYPDARANLMEIELKDSGDSSYSYMQVPLKPCMLTGAIGAGTSDYTSTSQLPVTNNNVNQTNKIYVSETGNPYNFQVTGIKTVGTGNIVGIAAVTRPLSQGQFGQFPLMVFSTDGIWALEQEKSDNTIDGLDQLVYGPTRSISREVCTNPKTILQLDQSVLFATDKALCVISGNELQSLTEVLNGTLRSEAIDLAKVMATGKEGMTELAAWSEPPINMLKNANGVYDAAKGRVLFFDPRASEGSKTVVMVLSLADNVWSTMAEDKIKACVNGYPHPYIQLNDGKIIKLDKGYNNEGEDQKNCMILTRTLSFSRSMDVIKQIYQAADGVEAPELWIFGSNDAKNWTTIGKTKRFYADYLPGHSFRYFRIGAVMKYSAQERYGFLSLDVINKYRHL